MKKLTLFLLPFIFFGSSIVFGEDTNIRVLEKKEIFKTVMVNRLCIGGYEFALICREYTEDQCYFFKESPSSMSQIITEEGGGKKC